MTGECDLPPALLRQRERRERLSGRHKELLGLLDELEAAAGEADIGHAGATARYVQLKASAHRLGIAVDEERRATLAAAYAVAARDFDAANAILDGDQVAIMNWLGPTGAIVEY